MAKSLVIVESPTKAKTLKKYMGRGYDVRASVGHLVDLPKSKLGVDVEKRFEPTYVVIKGKGEVLKELKQAAKGVDRILLATDPDREGEAIAWHIADKLKTLKKPIDRVEFNEITKRAVLEAIKHPRELDARLFEAQQARRVLDRLVGYKLSPLLWAKVRRGLSAGRVQSVALRLVVEREREVRAFIPTEYWSVDADLEGPNPPVFRAQLQRVAGKKVEIGSEKEATALVSRLEGASYKVAKVERKERRRRPAPAFTTSALQQEAARKLRFPARKTMTLAQRLYEGIDIGGEEGTVGLITYMRTDSVRLSDEAVTAVREHIVKTYGKEYLPETPNVYKSRKGAQEAHEAIRPTSADHTPELIKPHLGRDEFRLYQLIWRRFVACQMAPAVYDQTGVDIEATPKDGGKPLTLRVTGSVLKFKGFTAVYTEGHDEGETLDEGEGGDKVLPALNEGDITVLKKLLPEQHFTQPPPRYTEASLVKELEEKGIGRPSTYAAILSNIQDKKYVVKQENRFYPSEMGMLVTDLLTEHFPTVLDIGFTAQMESELDEIAEGKRPWVAALDDFYGPFSKNLEKAEVHMRDVKGEAIETEFDCEKCGSKMVLKWGRFGEFLACSRYPECKSTMNIKRAEDGSVQPVRPQDLAEPYPGKCDKCGSKLTLRKAWTGSRYVACEKYKDECSFTKPYPIGVTCPDCGGEVVERASRRRKLFYGCGSYPNCKFVAWYPPVAEKCPDCGSSYLLEKRTKRKGHHLACPIKECKYERILEGEDPEGGEADERQKAVQAGGG